MARPVSKPNLELHIQSLFRLRNGLALASDLDATTRGDLLGKIDTLCDDLIALKDGARKAG